MKEENLILLSNAWGKSEIKLRCLSRMFKECQAQWNEGNATNVDLFWQHTSCCSAPLGLCKNPLGFFFLLSLPSSPLTQAILQLLSPYKWVVVGFPWPAAKHPPSCSLIPPPLQQYRREDRKRKSKKNHGQDKGSLIMKERQERKKEMMQRQSFLTSHEQADAQPVYK